MIPLADLKALLGIAPGDTSQNVQITMLEAAAVAYVERFTGCYFGDVEDHEEVLRGTGSRSLWLGCQAGTPTAVHEAMHPGDEGEEIGEEGADGWLLRGRELVRKGGRVWRRGWEYTVAYPRGYAEGNAPPDIIAAVVALVGYRSRMLKTGGLWMKSETISGYSYTLAEAGQATDASTGMSAMDILREWKRVRV